MGEQPKVVDLMKALEESLAEVKAKRLPKELTPDKLVTEEAEQSLPIDSSED